MISLAAAAAAAAAKSLQSCPTLCDPIDGSPLVAPPSLDSPGKNTGVGCHFLLQCMKVNSESVRSVVSDSGEIHYFIMINFLAPQVVFKMVMGFN